MRWAAAAVRHPRLTLAVWIVLTLILAVQGLSFGERITPSSLDVPGTSSARAQAVADRYFGTEASIPVVLEGPRAELDEQGPELAAALRANGGLRVLSPWDGGRLAPELRPRGSAALVLVAGQTRNTFASGIGKDVRTVVRARVQSPVRASMSGFSVIGGELKDASLRAAHDAERLAIPLLALILLLVFRSPIAALVPAIFGIAAVESGYGAVGLLGELRPISDVATALTSMMGLALGVDYSLLLVSRFREELARGLAPVDAATAAQRTAGRTVLFAGVTLLVAMLAAILLTPGDFLFSAAASVATVAIISMAGAFLAVPALLALLGTNLDRWRIGQAPLEGGRWAALAECVQRHRCFGAARPWPHWLCWACRRSRSTPARSMPGPCRPPALLGPRRSGLHRRWVQVGPRRSKSTSLPARARSRPRRACTRWHDGRPASRAGPRSRP